MTGSTTAGDLRSVERQAANDETVARLASCRPRLVDVAPALEVVPGMTPSTILTSGAPLDPPAYEGVQRSAIIGGALYEGLADSEEDAWEQVIDGRIELRACHDHGCVGSVAGVYTASMPVFVVEDSVGRSSLLLHYLRGPTTRASDVRGLRRGGGCQSALHPRDRRSRPQGGHPPLRPARPVRRHAPGIARRRRAPQPEHRGDALLLANCWPA